MDQTRTIWLVTNSASGSNDDGTVELLQRCCGNAGFMVARHIHFPDEDLPKIADLRSAGIETVAVFAGDGTTNALITRLYGWEGNVLVLPGGTMNILYNRLHGYAETEEVLEKIASGKARTVRPGIVRCSRGDALAGLLVGPATAWNDVREAMRQNDLKAMMEGTAEALEQSLSAPTVICTDPPMGKREGYPLIMLTPWDDGIAVAAYHSETVDEYVAQGVALLKHNFREGPHDDLGKVGRLRLRDLSGEPLHLLLDGEPVSATDKEAEFLLVLCEVDLLATIPE
ncbi:diacylglycerol kinase family protein [Altericroceibacterium spongiae]|nr:diacylglycerol kinase family protein [Altericroceibacterium spongiae]